MKILESYVKRDNAIKEDRLQSTRLRRLYINTRMPHCLSVSPGGCLDYFFYSISLVFNAKSPYRQ